MMNDFIQIITDVGFPIACCVFLYIQMNKQSEQHHEEINLLSEAINNNTAAINQLREKIDSEES